MLMSVSLGARVGRPGVSEMVIEGCQDPSTLGSGHPRVSGVASSIASAIDQELISELGKIFPSWRINFRNRNYFSESEIIFRN